jgi:hypothetical protein
VRYDRQMVKGGGEVGIFLTVRRRWLPVQLSVKLTLFWVLKVQGSTYGSVFFFLQRCSKRVQSWLL